MKKFLAIYHTPAEAMHKMAQATEEQKAEGMKPWMEWKTKFNEQINDLGAPLAPGNKVSANGSWEPSGNTTSGYSIVSAENAEAAKKLFEGHPHTSWAPGCSIEVSELIEM